MSNLLKVSVSITTTGTGAKSGQVGRLFNGYLEMVGYSTGNGAFASSTGLVTVKTKDSAQTLFTQSIGAASFTKSPRLQLHSTGGGVLSFSTNSGAPIPGRWPIANEDLEVTIEKTTSAQTGQIDLWVEGRATST